MSGDFPNDFFYLLAGGTKGQKKHKTLYARTHARAHATKKTKIFVLLFQHLLQGKIGGIT